MQQVMLALCFMLFIAYYVKYYAGIIDASLIYSHTLGDKSVVLLIENHHFGTWQPVLQENLDFDQRYNTGYSLQMNAVPSGYSSNH